MSRAPLYLLRPLKAKERRESANLARLDNAAGTGWLPKLLATETEILDQAAACVAKNPAPADLAAFQKAAAGRALSLLKSIR